MCVDTTFREIPPRTITNPNESPNPNRPGFVGSSTAGVGVNHTSRPRLFVFRIIVLIWGNHVATFNLIFLLENLWNNQKKSGNWLKRGAVTASSESSEIGSAEQGPGGKKLKNQTKRRAQIKTCSLARATKHTRTDTFKTRPWSQHLPGERGLCQRAIKLQTTLTQLVANNCPPQTRV